jgi:nucleotide-binding universal stress UspA family protein
MSSSILCGVDGSEDARAALRAAAQLSGRLDVRLVAAHVVQAVSPEPALGLGTGLRLVGGPTGELEAGRALLDHVLDEEGLADAERHVVYGFPADCLADLADDEDAELIVVGSRGRGPFKAALLGSVSTALIGVARRPVLVVPRGAALSGLVDRPAAELRRQGTSSQS